MENIFPFDETNEKILTVSELTREIKLLLESSFPLIWVEGEISNFVRHSSGHMYFTLKDENAQIRAVMWRGMNERLKFRPEDGMKVLCQAELTVYEKSGNYQLKVLRMMPAGVGDLQIAFEQLKQKLAAEGLFDQKFKKAIPPFPHAVGVVTSPTGAAIRDIISVISRRAPYVQIILYPVRVQGDGAAEEIARAIREFNRLKNVDVLIVGRGGGSLEDLWAFNEEVVARAIFESEIPVISAVGHEIDFSISDFVADLRAPTPSAAAELVVRDRKELLQVLKMMEQKMVTAVLKKIQEGRERILRIEKSYGFRRPEDFILQLGLRIDELEGRMGRAMDGILMLNRSELRSLDNRLQALSPLKVLERGYSIVYKGDLIIKNARELEAGDTVHIRFHQGKSQASIIHREED